MRIITFAIAFLFLMIACAQPKISVLKKFTEQEYKTDLQELAILLKTNHPAMYEYISKEDFGKLEEKLLAELSDDTKVGDFVWLCRTLMAAVGCGHTYMPSQGERLWLPERYLFPLRVRYLDGELFVVHALENKDKLKSGDIITSINGILVNDLVSRFMKRVPADGHNQHFKMALINESFSDYMAFELSFPDSYTIEVDQKVIDLKATSKPMASISNLAPCPSNLCLEIKEDDKIALLTIRSFHYYGRETAKFKTFVDDAFEQISSAKIENLIIDIRGNGGGDPYSSAHLIQKIAKHPFQYYEDRGMAYDDLRQILEPSANVFDDEVYILTNGKNFSTSGHFCSLLKEHEFARFAGSPTGASYSCNANQFEFTLTKTGLKGSIAKTTFKTEVGPMSLTEGIKPDIEISLTKEEVLANKDHALEKLISHINSKDE